MSEIYAIYVFVLGACLGSFANVVIYRMPEGLSVVKPRSRCPQCKTQLKWIDNIPILGWVFLRGRCRYCQAAVSWRYPFVELLMASLFLLNFLIYKDQPYQMAEYFIFIFALVVCTFIDFDHMILPNEFTLSGIVIGLLGSLINPDRSFTESLIGVLMGGGFLWALAYFYFLFTKKEGMGGGDIKLLAWIGALLGFKAIPFVIMLSAIVGSVVGLIIAARSKTGLKTMIPFGPYLAFGAVVYMFGGQKLAEWYFHLFLPSLG
ncbi:MAG: prepilin peptidase [Pseudobdellovibrionaceae bacterium]